MKVIDVRGKLCPEPLIITKRTMREEKNEKVFKILLDNDIATCNLEALLIEMKMHFITHKGEGESSEIVFTIDDNMNISEVNVEEYCDIAPVSPEAGYVLVLDSESMGQDFELGKILIRGFINTLAEQENIPSKIIAYNSGVKLCSRGRDTVDALKKMKDRGTDIILCGVCVEYFELKSSVEVGRISNMMEIASVVSSVAHIIYP